MEMLFFTMKDCVPCLKMKEFINDLPIKVTTIDAEEDSALAEKYGIQSVPVLVFLNKETERGRLIGGKNKRAVERFIMENSSGL